MLMRMWRLLDRGERRRLLRIAPLLAVSAVIEVVGVASVIPFLSLLADPGAVADLPVVGPWLADQSDGDLAGIVRLSALVLAGLLVAANALVIVTKYNLFRYSWSLNRSISTRLLRHYLRQPYAYTLTRNTAELSNKVIVEVKQLITMGVQPLLNVLSQGVIIVALLVFLIALNPLLTTIVIVVLGGAYGAVYAVSRGYLRSAGREAVKHGAARIKAVNEALGAFKELKLASLEASGLSQYEVPSSRFAKIQATVQAIASLPRYALEAVAVGGMIVIATVFVGRDGSFAATLPLLGAYAFAGLRMMPAMQALFHAAARLRAAIGPLEAVEAEFAAASPDVDVLDAPPAPIAFREAIDLLQVSYSYPGTEERALADVNLRLVRGGSLAIVGRTGSGKTTIVDILLGLLEPSEGSVSVDGVKVDAGNRRAYRRLFGYVPQDIYLLDDTIRRNVALGLRDEAIDDAAVQRACRQAQVAEFIEGELPGGYETVVGERGVRLSGGQRQRIGIARALYNQPSVLVFDEATSALDVHTEQQVFAALDAIARERTLVTIAHRLETVAKADTVIVLAAGRVVDEGSPLEVLARFQQGAVV